jgi:hypothetical protein
MTNVEIIVVINGTRYKLDTFDDTPMPLTYQVTDLTDITSVNSSYSKTITLPETGNNRAAFQMASELSADSTFNPNTKTRCYILADSVIVFEGYLQLTKVTDNYGADMDTFEVVVYASNDNLWKNIGELFLEDIPMTEFNHTYNAQNISNSWTQSCDTSAYFYPLIDYNDDWTMANLQGHNSVGGLSLYSGVGIPVQQMYPATYVKVIVDKIFNGAGYQYTSNFFNSSAFKNLLIPFNRPNAAQNPTFSYNRSFIAGMSAQTSYTYGSPGIYQNQKINLNDVSTPFGDPIGLFNTTTHDYTCNDGTFKQRFAITVDIDVYKPGIHVTNVYMVPYRSQNVNGTTTTGWTSFGTRVLPINGGNVQFDVLNINIVPTNLGGNWYNYKTTIYTDALDNSDNNHQGLRLGEQVRLEMNTVVQNGDASPNMIVHGITASVGFGTYMYNQPDTTLIEGQPLDYSQVLPQNIKQRDFLLSIINMFNLIVEPLEDNMLRIEPRDDYYNSGVIKDWSNKVDLDQDWETQILGDIQDRTTTFTYKTDSDYLNTLFFNTTNTIYGQFIFTASNDFAVTDKKVEAIFSPTPLTSVGSPDNPSNFVISKIGKAGLQNLSTSGSPQGNIRILQKNSASMYPTQPNEWWMFKGTKYYSYPYAGHLDDPNNPNFDINFGQNGLYYPQYVVTQGNLVHNYWLKQLHEYQDKDSRVITAAFYLTPQDIYNFHFSDKIFVNDQYYKVMLIDGYDPTKVQTCKVTMIKTLDITVKKTQVASQPWNNHVSLLSALVYRNLGNFVLSEGSVVAGYANYVGPRSDSSFIVGEGNNVGSDSAQAHIVGIGNIVAIGATSAHISGDGNMVFPQTNAHIIGNGNVIGTASLANVIGDNNILAATLSNTSIFGRNNVVQGSGNVYGDGNTMHTSTIGHIYGNNNLMIAGVTNTTMVGREMTATLSNTVYISDVVFQGTASGTLDLGQVLNIGNDAQGYGINDSTGTFSLGMNNFGSTNSYISYIRWQSPTGDTSGTQSLTMSSISLSAHQMLWADVKFMALTSNGIFGYSNKAYGVFYHDGSSIQLMNDVDTVEKTNLVSIPTSTISTDGSNVNFVIGSNGNTLNWVVTINYGVDTMIYL